MGYLKTDFFSHSEIIHIKDILSQPFPFYHRQQWTFNYIFNSPEIRPVICSVKHIYCESYHPFWCPYFLKFTNFCLFLIMLIFFLLNKLYISLALCDLFTHTVCHDTMYRIRSVSFDIYAPISSLRRTYLCSLQISRTHLLYIYFFFTCIFLYVYTLVCWFCQFGIIFLGSRVCHFLSLLPLGVQFGLKNIIMWS